MMEHKKAMVDPKLLDILVCPLTKGPLRYDRQRQELISEKARLAYPIREGIPVMLVEEARKLDEIETPDQKSLENTQEEDPPLL